MMIKRKKTREASADSEGNVRGKTDGETSEHYKLELKGKCDKWAQVNTHVEVL